ncbi:MAG: hypothetical protein ACK4GN_15880 [Runella sp.]
MKVKKITLALPPWHEPLERVTQKATQLTAHYIYKSCKIPLYPVEV